MSYQTAHLICQKCRKTTSEARPEDAGTTEILNCPACGERYYWLGKPLMLPEVTKLSELFEAIKPRTDWKEKSPFPRKFFPAQAWKWNSRKRKTLPRPCSVPVSSFLSLSPSAGSGFEHAWISPSEALIKAIAKGWIGDAERETVNVQIVVRADGTALVTADNNLILACRWIALLDVSELSQLRTAEVA